MLIKSADDKSQRLTLLEALEQSHLLTDEQKKWCSEELHRVRTGIQGEKEAAYYINADFVNSRNYVVLHDLRICVDGQTAQIDHLLVSDVLICMLETKNFNANVTINEHGEFSLTYPGSKKSFGIASPLEQSRRHEKVLRKLLDRLGIKSRTGLPLDIEHVVLFHPRAIIKRPDSKKFDTSNIIKADALRSWHNQFFATKVGILKTLGMLPNLRSKQTVNEWGEKIARQHRPANPLALPDFMPPRSTPPTAAIPAITATTAAATAQATAADSTTHATAMQMPDPAAPVTPALGHGANFAQASSDTACATGSTCTTCGKPITEKVAQHCRANALRFKGKLYCFEHQKAIPKPKSTHPARPSASHANTGAANPLASDLSHSHNVPEHPYAPSPAQYWLCAACHAPISNAENAFCQKHAQRFGGMAYCRKHQANFPAKAALHRPASTG